MPELDSPAHHGAALQGEFDAPFPSAELRAQLMGTDEYQQHAIIDAMRTELAERGLSPTTKVTASHAEALELIRNPGVYLTITIPEVPPATQHALRRAVHDELLDALARGSRFPGGVLIDECPLIQGAVLPGSAIARTLSQQGFEDERIRSEFAESLVVSSQQRLDAWAESDLLATRTVQSKLRYFRVDYPFQLDFHYDFSQGSGVSVAQVEAGDGGSIFFVPGTGIEAANEIIGAWYQTQGVRARAGAVPDELAELNEVYQREIVTNYTPQVQVPVGCTAYYTDATGHRVPDGSALRALQMTSFRK